jgi:hypothetical protein
MALSFGEYNLNVHLFYFLRLVLKDNKRACSVNFGGLCEDITREGFQGNNSVHY